MGEVVAGWTAGYAMFILATLASVYLLVRYGDARFVRRYTNGEMNPLVLSIPASLGSFFGWTMAGMIIGSIYRLAGLDDQRLGFFAAIVAFGVLPVPALVIFFPRLWWMWTGFALAFIGLFGLFMPFMAEQW